MKRALLPTLLLTAACGGEPIPDTPLSGRVGGAAWALGTAHTDAFFSDDDSLFIGLFAESFAACGPEPTGDPNQLIFTVPPREGEGVFNVFGGVSLTFVVNEGDGLSNLIATEGAYEIETLTADRVVGRVRAEFDADNVVSGRFEATRCADDR